MFKKNFKKKDIVDILSSKTGFSSNLSKKIVDDLLHIININIQEGELILKNLGSFKILNKKQRIGRNPKTKEEVMISERNVISFTPSKRILLMMNNKINEKI